MKIINLFKSVCFLGLLLITVPGSGQREMFALENGDQIAWDGSYYDFRDSEGVKMIKIWIPPGVHPIKGVFISGHGGGGGDSRNFARDENVRALAMRLGYAVAGLHNFPGRRVYEEGAEVFFHALDEFAGMGHHPELAHLPFVMYGSSNGGSATYGFINYAPERAICFVANVSAGGNPEVPVDEALRVPGVFIMGEFDALIGQRGIDRTEKMMTYAREKGALWSWALELKGHEDGFSFDIYMKLVEQAVKLRYPKKGDPSKGQVKLIALKEKEGWLVDQDSWDSGLTYVDSFKKYTGDKIKAGWVLNKDMAFVYRSLATYHNPLKISVKEFDRTFNPHTDPGTMFSLGGPVANPGDRITIACDTSLIPGWEKIEVFNGADKLGEVLAGTIPEITTSLEATEEVYCLTALASLVDGEMKTCDPMHFFVRDPELGWESELPVPQFEGAKTNSGSMNVGKVISWAGYESDDSVLVAYGLTGEMEAQYSSSDNKLSDFWKLIDSEHDRIRLKQRSNAARGANFNFVLSHDCNMEVRAAYGADGIYLLIEINDDNDVAWPNEFVGTENEQFYLEFDAVDLLTDSRSIHEIANPTSSDLFVSRSFGLTFTTRQYQVACGVEGQRPTGFKRALSDPWDFNGTFYTFENAQSQFGIQIENIKTDYFYKAQEWFIPWSEYGGGLTGEPAAGTRLAFTAGFNDRDEGEHFPPGVNSSGGSVKASNALRWIGATDPWGSNKPPYGWGEIELGEILK
ncbi:MAG: hypothetical protein QNK35_15260 [Bacteroides sp.]|nr:hypothetical protein [Bacteroides sp.]